METTAIFLHMVSESLNICKSSDDPAKTPHLQLSWQTKDELHKIDMSHIEASYCCQQETVGLHKKWSRFYPKKNVTYGGKR